MARKFVDTSSQYMTLDVGSDLDSLTALTVAFRFRCDTNNTFYMLAAKWYYHWGVFYPDGGWNIHHHDSLGLRAEICYDGGSSSDDLREGSVSISADEWHHAALTWATTYRALYLDGALVDSDSTSRTSITDTSYDLWLAAEHRSDSPNHHNHLDGQLADLGIWPVALTAAEVGALAAGFSPLLIRPQSHVLYSPLIRDEDQDLIGGRTWTAVNSPTVDAHPPILRPSLVTLGVPTAGAPPPPPAGAQLLALLGVGV
jgi:hypothetical protein